MHWGACLTDRVDLYLGGPVGKWVLDLAHPQDVSNVITTEKELAQFAQEHGFRGVLADQASPPALGAVAISVHYPRIFPTTLIEQYRCMYNLHPGFLPWGRGFYPVFWALWEGTPAGATFHVITPGLDRGPIVDQIQVDYSATDTGWTLHQRVQQAERDLFRRYWRRILNGEELDHREQPAGGTYHSKLKFFDLKASAPWESMSGADLIRLTRALTFPGFTGLTLDMAGQRHELAIRAIDR